MLQAHSSLWNCLWVGPNALLLLLGGLLWARGLWRRFPTFLAFAVVSAVGDLSVFYADIAPYVSAANFWRIDWASLLLESLVKFIVIGELFFQVLEPYRSVSRLGRNLARGSGAALVLLGAFIAGLSRSDSTMRLISGAHVLEQTVFIVELGLVLFIFLFAGFFHLPLDRLSFGILLGFGISACEHLAAWAILANAAPSAHGRTLIDFLNMATHLGCVLIWYYYWLVPKKTMSSKDHSKRPPTQPPSDPPTFSGGSPQDHEEAVNDWNRELERLIHQ
ncbi:MAG: hypothetical protein WAM79_18510 [Candidatus Sulfotelmatobacter sp.]